MAIENDTIIKKMLKEINEARECQHNQDQFLKHIANVKLLCDLFLEEDNETVNPSSKESFSEAELKAMIGEQEAIKKVQEQQIKQTQKIDHEEANGSSIFEF